MGIYGPGKSLKLQYETLTSIRDKPISMYIYYDSLNREFGYGFVHAMKKKIKKKIYDSFFYLAT